MLARHAKQVTEGAGAASLAAAIKLRDELRGKKVVGIVSGGNLPLERFATLISLKFRTWEEEEMAELLQEYTTVITGPDDTTYTVRSYGEERVDGTWIGWLEFEPTIQVNRHC